LAVAACSTSSQAPVAPSAAPEPPGQTPASAIPAREPGKDDKEEATDFAGQLAALNKAEAQLNMVMSGRKDMAKEPGGTSPGKAPQPNPRPGVKSGESMDQAGDPCATACTALASMTRATTHLCGLTGEGDSRCEDARTRVRNATDRVRASCPACAG